MSNVSKSASNCVHQSSRLNRPKNNADYDICCNYLIIFWITCSINTSLMAPWGAHKIITIVNQEQHTHNSSAELTGNTRLSSPGLPRADQWVSGTKETNYENLAHRPKVTFTLGVNCMCACIQMCALIPWERLSPLESACLCVSAGCLPT